ncbi:hypothetical protein phi2077_00013 [Klebsiella phage phi_2077]|nr:hypothetical protein phi2077_00013 [Klebsiella phage phi_2077]
MSNKIWVLTYTIGTNEGRKSRRLICETKEQAIMQQTVLGGDLVEYFRKPEAFKVNWPEGMDINGALASLREMQKNPITWSDFQCLSGETENEEDRICNNEHMRDLVVDEISSLIDDISNHSPLGVWEHPGSSEWDCAKVDALNNIRKLLNAIR